MIRRTLNLRVAASIPWGASFLEVHGMRDSSEHWNGFPVLYLEPKVARNLPRRFFRRSMEDVAVSFDGRMQTWTRIAGIEWDIDREEFAERFACVEINGEARR